MAVIEKKAKIMTSAGHLMNTTRHHHAIINHHMQVREPRIGGDAWTEVSEKARESHLEIEKF